MASSLTKRMIMDSLMKLLDERPLSKVSIKDIVEDCGINRNTFYYHFSDLPDLIECGQIQDELWAGRLCFCGLIGPDDGLNTGFSPQVLLVFPQIVSRFQVTPQHQVCLPEQAVER